MPLFQQSVLKKYINDLNKEALHNAWGLFQLHFHNPAIQQNMLNAKEEEYQEGFVRDLFVNILGYTLKPQPGYNLVMEQKSTSDATKSDGAILSSTGGVVAVIELKDTNTTDLAKVEKQAFGYKHQHKDCVYVITANFEKLRVYISDAINFEEFDLFRMDKERFALLYCCLQQQALHNNVPLQMKQQSAAAEENITKKLYADYSKFKQQLFENIAQKNAQYNKLDLFKKTQKLLDRFLFILFAEDRLLLPPNSVRDILQQWEQLKELDNYVPLYDRFKKYFGYLNTGYQGKQYEIFAYNGGLFAADEILDNITIDDTILYESCKGLSNYDFESEVDVNILGHIFEHSLGEIEEVEKELTASINLKESESVSSAPLSFGEGPGVRSVSKRKKDGVFYTPRYITKYIVENTIGTLCTQQKELLQIVDEAFAPQKRKANTQQLLQKLDDYRNWLLQLTICDPACGSGAFLNQALEFLIAEHRNIDELKAKLFGDALTLSDVEASILENNLYGVDINDEATEIAKLSLWLRTARKGRKLNNLNQHIKCGNSLIDDPAVAGDKAFNWQKEFPQVFAKGGFDVVIGNPPYGASLSKKEKLYFDNNYETTQYNYDTYCFFFEKSFYLLNVHGYLGYITPNTFLVVELGDKLRKFLFEKMNLKELLETFNVFDDAVVEPIVSIFSKSHSDEKKTINVYLNNRGELKFISKESLNRIEFGFKELFERSNLIFNYRATKDDRLLIQNIKTKSKELSAYAKVTAGVILYENGKGFPIQDAEILKTKPYTSYVHKSENWLKLIRGADVQRYNLNWSGEFVLYGKNLAAPRKEDNFYNSKLFVRRTDDNLMFSYDDQKMIGVKSVHCVQTLEKKIDEKYLLPILNSKLLNWVFRFENFHMIGKPFSEVKLVYVERLPIIISADQLPFISKADIMLSKNKELQQLQQQLLQLLQGKYQGLTINNKLRDWPSLSFGNFLKELDKQKIKLSLPEQAEWMQYFDAEKTKANAIQQLISITDKEIDNMVYELYGLTAAEIAIVEEG